MRALWRSIFLTAVMMLAGCAGKKITEIVVAIATDLEIPKELQVVQFQVAHPDAKTDSGFGPWVIDTPFDVVTDKSKEKGIELPATIGLLPEGDPSMTIYIKVLGLDGNKVPQLERTARLPFARDRIVLIHMNLLRNCLFAVKKPPCDKGYTCEDGVCIPDTQVPIHPLTDAQVDLPRGDAKSDLRLDAGRDKSVVDLGKDKSGVDLGKDKSVVDHARDKSVIDQARDKSVVDQSTDKSKTPDKSVVVDQATDKTKTPDKSVVVDQAKDKTSAPDKMVVDQAKDKVSGVDAGCVQPPPVASCIAGWCKIPAGCFWMGSPTAETCKEADEYYHQVTLTHEIEMQQTEVTVAQWSLFPALGADPSSDKTCGSSCPVEYLTWHQAAAYCNELSAAAGKTPCYSCTGTGKTTSCSVAGAYLSTYYDCPGYRLPTEAEQEYAVRATTTTRHYIAPTACAAADTNVGKIAWYYYNTGVGKKQAVGQKQANGWGLYDMTGNVWEWTSDEFYNPQTPPYTDPFTPAVSNVVMHSGSFEDIAIDVRSANRKKYAKVNSANGQGYYNVGFRCVRSTTGTVP